MRIKKILSVIAMALVVAIIGVVTVPYIMEKSQRQGTGYGPVANSYQAIGSVTSPASLTTSYNTNSTTIRSQYAEKLVLDLRLLGGTTTSTASILVEGSNDGGTTYYPIAYRTASTTEYGVYSEDGSGAVGIPFVFPADRTISTSTPLLGTFILDIGYEWIRISAKANSVITSTLAIQATTISY